MNQSHHTKQTAAPAQPATNDKIEVQTTPTPTAQQTPRPTSKTIPKFHFDRPVTRRHAQQQHIALRTPLH